MKPLLALSDEILALEADLERDGLTDDQREALVDAWLEAQGNAAEKLDNYAAWIESCEAMAEQRKYQAERIGKLAQADENRATKAKERLKAYFERHELKKFQTARFSLTLQRNGGKAPLILPETWEADPASAPEAFQQRIIKLDREAIREAVGTAAVGSIHELCPQCGERTDFDEGTEQAACLSCGWRGSVYSTIRLGERGSSIRIR